MSQSAKKLALILTIFFSIIMVSMKANFEVLIFAAKSSAFIINNSALPLKYVLYIYH